ADFGGRETRTRGDWKRQNAKCEIQKGRVGSEPGVFEWRGKVWRANDLFRAGVLGEFPLADDRALIPLSWVEAAVERELEEAGYCRAAVDVAHFGGDETVFGVRVGPKVVLIEPVSGKDTVEVT